MKKLIGYWKNLTLVLALPLMIVNTLMDYYNGWETRTLEKQAEELQQKKDEEEKQLKELENQFEQNENDENDETKENKSSKENFVISNSNDSKIPMYVINIEKIEM